MISDEYRMAGWLIVVYILAFPDYIKPCGGHELVSALLLRAI